MGDLDPLTASGHLDPATWERADVIVVKPSDGADDAATYAVACHRCGVGRARHGLGSGAGVSGAALLRRWAADERRDRRPAAGAPERPDSEV